MNFLKYVPRSAVFSLQTSLHVSGLIVTMLGFTGSAYANPYPDSTFIYVDPGDSDGRWAGVVHEFSNTNDALAQSVYYAGPSSQYGGFEGAAVDHDSNVSRVETTEEFVYTSSHAYEGGTEHDWDDLDDNGQSFVHASAASTYNYQVDIQESSGTLATGTIVQLTIDYLLTASVTCNGDFNFGCNGTYADSQIEAVVGQNQFLDFVQTFESNETVINDGVFTVDFIYGVDVLDIHLLSNSAANVFTNNYYNFGYANTNCIEDWIASGQDPGCGPYSSSAWAFADPTISVHLEGYDFNVDKQLVDTPFSGAYTDVSAVPIPAAVWLFGSGLIGLIGVARRKKA